MTCIFQNLVTCDIHLWKCCNMQKAFCPCTWTLNLVWLVNFELGLTCDMQKLNLVRCVICEIWTLCDMQHASFCNLWNTYFSIFTITFEPKICFVSYFYHCKGLVKIWNFIVTMCNISIFMSTICGGLFKVSRLSSYFPTLILSWSC